MPLRSLTASSSSTAEYPRSALLFAASCPAHSSANGLFWLPADRLIILLKSRKRPYYVLLLAQICAAALVQRFVPQNTRANGKPVAITGSKAESEVPAVDRGVHLCGGEWLSQEQGV